MRREVDSMQLERVEYGNRICQSEKERLMRGGRCGVAGRVMDNGVMNGVRVATA
jgi:hypothetical protein